MSRHLSPSNLAVTLSLLVLVACNENTTPTGTAEPVSEPSAVAAMSPDYSVQDLEVNILGGEFAFATAINTAGHVVGTRFQPGDTERAFLWKDGVVTDLGTLGGHNALAHDINDIGHVVGASRTRFGNLRAFRWKNGTMNALGSLGGNTSRAFAVNNQGHVVGESQLRGNRVSHAFLVKNGVMTDLGTLGGAHSAALDINDAGQVVGWSQTANGTRHPFLWENGVMKDLLPPGSASISGRANAINAIGAIVGERNNRAFRYFDGVMHVVGAVGPGPSVATDIGVGSLAGDVEGRGFVFTGGQRSLLPLLPDGFRSSAHAINRRGDIAGTVSTEGAPGEIRAVIWIKN